MNIKISLLLGLFIIISACAHKHVHDPVHSHSHTDSQMRLNNSQKWKADEILSKNMNAIYEDLLLLREKESNNKVLLVDYQQFQNKVNTAIEEIISKCQMSPDMDETYHVVLEKLMAANSDLTDSKKQKEATGQFEKAFHLYKRYFK